MLRSQYKTSLVYKREIFPSNYTVSDHHNRTTPVNSQINKGMGNTNKIYNIKQFNKFFIILYFCKIEFI